MGWSDRHGFRGNEVGSLQLPPVLVFFSTVTFASIASLSSTLQRNCSRHRLKNFQKLILKGVGPYLLLLVP